MENNFTDFLIELTNISPRRGINEQKAAQSIKKYLTEAGVDFTTQEFETIIPDIKKAELYADGEKIPCLGASFVSGHIDNKATIVNATGPNVQNPMIIFNPVSLGVCLQQFKKYPAVTINRDSVIQLIMANNIKGEVIVEDFKFISQNILVGNTSNPENIVFAHYDSLIGGALDNGGAVDVLYQLITDDKNLLINNLFVFIGSEEESTSSEDGLWGFNIFDKKYHELLLSCKKVIVLDGVGIGKPKFVSNHIDWVFGVDRDMDKISPKVLWMQNDQTIVMKYYHSDLDTISILKTEHLNEAKELLLSEIS
ncbi:hypothetical protein H6802_00340 [Candidatus Nomurabacteria bacterium]|uniref:Peptidase M28 domain-containing protein n=1 Tax=candidate division WWE3 bacterium TaxID=2053526 RepID=A0A955E102_UNCKA|nr:hypothetical protein [candidate division WWE3 bacterium]MCB9823399.1 hypothetical protein [Candidatus Nomurabacteria bacterium]MCB9827681.1 hypothetical protein [Candidatus Nomurabacteria bacterium]